MEFFSFIAALLIIFSRKHIIVKINLINISLITLIIIIIIWFFTTSQPYVQNTVIGCTYLLTAFLLINASAEINEDILNKIIYAVFSAALTNFAVQIIQITQTEELLNSDFFLPLIGNRPFGNIGQPNLLATLQTTAICCLYYLYKKNLINKLSLYTLSLPLIIGIALSDSRTSVLSLISISIISFFHFTTTKKNKTLYQYLLTSTLLLIISKLAVSQYLPQRLLATENYGSSRLEMWELLITAIKNKPFLGYGFNNTSIAHFENSDPFPVWWNQNIQQSHNIFIDFFIWFGIPIGLTISILFVFCFLKSIRNQDSKIFVYLILAIPLLIHSLLEYPLHYFFLILPFCIFMGNISKNMRAERSITIPNKAVLFIIVPLGIICIEYFRIQNISILHLKNHQYNEISSSIKPLRNHILDELGEQISLIKPIEKTSLEEIEKIKYLVKIYPTKYNFEKIIKSAETLEEKKYWENKKQQLTEK